MNKPFENILLAYDGSSEAQIALDRAIDLALSWSSRLTIVTVYQRSMMWAVGPMLPPEPPVTVEKQALNDMLRKAVETAEQRGVSHVRGELLEDHPAEGILTFAGVEHADLVVMGSRGRSAAPRLLLGSVSDAVIHHARVAVLVIRSPPAGRTSRKP
jgi:nucleotide-binding universal stress UspA family protein